MNKGIAIVLIVLSIWSCTKYEVVFDADVTEDYELALILNLDGKDCFFEASTNTLKYSIDDNSLNDFSPFTTFQDHSSIKFNDTLLINNSINSFGAIALNTSYALDVETNGSVRALQLVFTNRSLIQVVTIDEIRNEPKILGKINVHYPDIFSEAINSYIGIEIRGKSTATLDKKSYGFAGLGSKDIKDRITMSFFDMGTNSKWALDAMAIDLSKVRNTTSFDIWNSLSNSSIKSQYVELFLNYESLGLYRFSEIYTEYLLNMTDNSSLYVGNANSDVTQFSGFPDKEPNSALWHDWGQEYPDPSEIIYWDNFYEMTKLISQGDDEEFVKNIGTHIDLNNVIDYYLFVNLCYGKDNVAKNCYYFKEDTSSKFQILVWDLDATWGRDHTAAPQDYDVLASNNLFNRLIEVNPNEFREKLKARWLLLRADQYSESKLLNQFDLNFKEVIAFQKELSEIQMIDSHSEIENEQTYINTWIGNRLIFLDNYYNNL